MVSSIGSGGVPLTAYLDAAIEPSASGRGSGNAAPGLEIIGTVVGYVGGGILAVGCGSTVGAAIGLAAPSLALGTGEAFLGREIGEQFTFDNGHENLGKVGTVLGTAIGTLAGIPLDLAAAEVTVPLGTAIGGIAGVGGLLGSFAGYQLVDHWADLI
jgi:hypothetical protein